MFWFLVAYHPKDYKAQFSETAGLGLYGQLRQLLCLGCQVCYLSTTPGIYGLGVKTTQGALIKRNMTRIWPGTLNMCLQTSICAVLGVGMCFSLLCTNKCCSILGTSLQSSPCGKPLRILSHCLPA